MIRSSRKLRVAVLFGGRSAEHDVSLASAFSILQNIDTEKYDVVPVKISREGRWTVLPNVHALDSPKTLEAVHGKTVLVGDPSSRGLVSVDGPDGIPARADPSHEPVDLVFPVLHGTFGEDGTVQGLLQLADIPCVGGGVLASALGMDKVLQKQVFREAGIPIVDFLWFPRKEWVLSPGPIRDRIRTQIGFPCFVKPANLGSSVGVLKIKNERGIGDAVDEAARFDRKLIVEKAIDARELECAVLGNDDPRTSVVGEIVPCNEFYDYEAKYLRNGSQTLIPADIPAAVSDEVQRLAMGAFKALDGAGMARVDFFLERQTERVFLNEINTIPGFTPISMYPKLWEASGIAYPELIDRLIELALERYADLHQSRFRRE